MLRSAHTIRVPCCAWLRASQLVAVAPFGHSTLLFLTCRASLNTSAQHARVCTSLACVQFSRLVVFTQFGCARRKPKLVWCACKPCCRAGDRVRGAQVSKSTKWRHQTSGPQLELSGTKRKAATQDLVIPLAPIDSRDGEPMELGDLASERDRSSVQSGSTPSSPASAPASAASGQCYLRTRVEVANWLIAHIWLFCAILVALSVDSDVDVGSSVGSQEHADAVGSDSESSASSLPVDPTPAAKKARVREQL